jgi:hypothetical protein
MAVLPQVTTIDGDLPLLAKQGGPELVARTDNPSLPMQAYGYLLHSDTSREPFIF